MRVRAPVLANMLQAAEANPGVSTHADALGLGCNAVHGQSPLGALEAIFACSVARVIESVRLQETATGGRGTPPLPYQAQ